jgi:hypothetical protein
MTEEIEGLDEEISPIERWQASVIAHEAASVDRRLLPAIEEHPDGHKSTKMLERQNQDLERHRTTKRLQKNWERLDLGSRVKGQAPPRSRSADSASEPKQIVVPASPDTYVKLLMFGELRRTITVPSAITREELRKRASQEFGGRVAIQPEAIPVTNDSTVVCYPTYMPETAKGEPQIPAVTPYFERAQKLYPVEVPASATFDDMVIIASNIMGCACRIRMDTRFPLRTDDHISFVTEEDIHLEQMKLEALRAEDEVKMQQKLNAIQWTMADVPPRPATREYPALEQAVDFPRPESVSKWGEEIEVKFEDISGTQGSQPVGHVFGRREGNQWDKAASDAFGIPMQITAPRTEIAAGESVILKCKPIFGLDEMTAPISAPNHRQFRAGKSIPVRIKLQFKDRMVPLEVLNSAPVASVEFQARVHFGVAVEFMIPKPTAWYPGKIYQMRRVKQGGGQTKPPTTDVKVKMTVRYSVVSYSIPNVIIPSGAATRDVLIAWWNAVERNQVKDPNILCLSRNPEMYEFQDDTGENYFDIEEGMEIVLIPKDRTSPEVVRIDVTWDGFDEDRLPIRLSISPRYIERHHVQGCYRYGWSTIRHNQNTRRWLRTCLLMKASTIGRITRESRLRHHGPRVSK